MKYKRITACIAAAMLLCTACAENPDSAIIKHKDMEKVISEANDSGENRETISEYTVPERYSAKFENESLHVKVRANAEIVMPQVETLSVVHVEKAQFSQEFTDRVRKALLGDQPVYDGKLTILRTKQDVLDEIGEWRERIQNPPADDTELYLEEYQKMIDEILQPEYNAAPEKIVFADYPSDGLLHPVRELYEAEKAAAGGTANPNSYYAQRLEIFPDAEMLSCVTDDADGMYASFYVQNSPNGSSSLSFSRSALGLVNKTTGLDFVTGKYAVNCGLPTNTLAYYAIEKRDYEQLPGNTAELSQEDAQKQAEQFLSALGLDAFALYEGGLFTELVEFMPAFTPEDLRYYRTNYILRYFRSMDGCPLLRGGFKFSQTENYQEKSWDDEMIEIRVDDNGIIGFDYISPLKPLETTVSDAALKPFDEITAAFETMAPILTADENEQFSVETVVDRVELCYLRLAEKDSFDTGYAVPVWNYYGKRTFIAENGERIDAASGAMQDLLVSINAIDGSVIVPGAGY